MRLRARWIVGIAVGLLGGAAALLTVAAGTTHTSFEVRCALSLRVLDERTGQPIRGAEVFAGDPFDVHDERWRERRRAAPEEADVGRPCPPGYARSDAAGFVVVEACTRHCSATSGWQRLAGTSPGWLDGWPGVSFRVVAPGHLPHIVDGVKAPRRERPRADGVPGNVVLLDLGTLALEPEGP